MKWTELQPVKKGDVIALTICGVHRLWRVKRDARDVLDLCIKDFEPA